MKKISFLTLCVFVFSFFFIACDKDKDKPKPPIDEIIEDGFYVTGAATASAELIAKNIMSPGINEAAEQTPRAGMYEKYVALEGGKEFNLLLKEGTNETKYGAEELTEVDLTANENENPKVKLLKGNLKENVTLKVNETGLYHIVLDLNKDNLLKAPQIVIAPVTWGIRGGMNGWGFTPFEAGAFNKETIEFSLKEQAIKTSEEFKFAYGEGWKIDLDDEGKVKANTNLGKDLKPGGVDIKIEKSAVYTVKLTWTLNSGAIADNFKVEYVKTGDVDIVNYKDCELELVGDGVDESNKGAKKDETSGWNWGHTLSAGKPKVEGTVYTWTWANVKLKADGLKIRTIDGKESGGVNSFDVGFAVVNTEKSPNVEEAGGNIKAKEAGNYKIVMTIDAASEKQEIVITKI